MHAFCHNATDAAGIQRKALLAECGLDLVRERVPSNTYTNEGGAGVLTRERGALKKLRRSVNIPSSRSTLL